MDLKQLDYLSMIRLDVSIWSARAKLRAEDLPHEISGSLPPEELSTLGSKRLFNPDDLKIFNTLKARAASTLDKHGVRFLGGWATHEDRLPTLAGELSQIAMEFDDAKKLFLGKYVEGVAAWAGNFPSWAHILINAVPKLHEIEHKFMFNFQMYKIAPEDTVNSFVGNNLTDSLANLEDAVFVEVARDIAAVHKECFAGKNTVTKKAFRPIRTLIDKVKGLTFIHSHLYGLESVLTFALNSGENSADNPAAVNMLKNFLVTLSNPQSIKDICSEFVDQNKELCDLFDPFWMLQGAPQAQPVLTPPPGWTVPGVQKPAEPEVTPGKPTLDDIASAVRAIDDYELRQKGLTPELFDTPIPADDGVGTLDGGGLW